METQKCPNCGIQISQVEINCENCGYPLSGTDKEKSIFIGKQIANKSKIGDAKESQGKAASILYIVGGFQIFNAFRAYSGGFAKEDIIFYVILGILLIVFGLFSSKKPLLFLSLALLLILGYYALLFSINPEFLFQGIVWKIIIIAFLGYGIWNTIEAQNLKKENKFLNKK